MIELIIKRCQEAGCELSEAQGAIIGDICSDAVLPNTEPQMLEQMTYREAMDYLAANGKIIEKGYSELAKKVMSAYKFHFIYPKDPDGISLLIEATLEYKQDVEFNC